MNTLIDWTEIIADLRSRGFSERVIARRVGTTSQSTVHRLATGEIKDPCYSTGAALLRLHACRDSGAPV